jgi:hypothetical protein
MAIWHFQFFIVPANAAPPIETTDGIDSSASWGDATEPSWPSITGGDLQQVSSWSPDVELWGDEKTIQIYIVRMADKIVDCFVRVDVRSDPTELLSKLLFRLKDAGLSLAFPPDEPVAPSLTDVLERLKHSKPYRLFHGPKE